MIPDQLLDAICCPRCHAVLALPSASPVTDVPAGALAGVSAGGPAGVTARGTASSRALAHQARSQAAMVRGTESRRAPSGTTGSMSKMRLPIVAVPPSSGPIEWMMTCRSCGARYPQHTRDYVDLRPPTEFAEQTKYLDEALHADARHETVSPPLLASAIRQRQLRNFLRLSPRDTVIDLGCGSGRSVLWNQASGALIIGTDVSPYFAHEARERVPLALGDLRQLPFPDGTFTKGYALDVLEHLSPEALDAMLREAARILAPGGVLFVYSHVRKNSPLARGLRMINSLARGLERIGLIDMTQERLRKSDHLNPLRDIPHLEQVAADAGFRIAKIRYYTPLIGGFVENIMMRVAERAMTKRAARRIASEPATTTTTSAIKVARTQAKARIAKNGPIFWTLRGLTWLMEIDILLFSRVRTGPFFALLEKKGHDAP